MLSNYLYQFYHTLSFVSGFGLTLIVLYMRIWILCRQNIYNFFPILFFSRGFILSSTYIVIFSMSLSNYRKWSSIKPFWFSDQILESTFSDWLLVDASSLVIFMWFVFVYILHVDSEINQNWKLKNPDYAHLDKIWFRPDKTSPFPQLYP